jgi:hypothetical protein
MCVCVCVYIYTYIGIYTNIQTYISCLLPKYLFPQHPTAQTQKLPTTRTYVKNMQSIFEKTYSRACELCYIQQMQWLEHMKASWTSVKSEFEAASPPQSAHNSPRSSNRDKMSRASQESPVSIGNDWLRSPSINDSDEPESPPIRRSSSPLVKTVMFSTQPELRGASPLLPSPGKQRLDAHTLTLVFMQAARTRGEQAVVTFPLLQYVETCVPQT